MEKGKRSQKTRRSFLLVDDSFQISPKETENTRGVKASGEEAGHFMEDSVHVSLVVDDSIGNASNDDSGNANSIIIGNANDDDKTNIGNTIIDTADKTTISPTTIPSTPITRTTEESDDDALVVCTSSDGSIRVSHSSSFWRESKPSSKPTVTSFTEAVHTEPIDERRKEEEAARQALFSRLVSSNQNALHERKQDLLKKYRHFSSQNAFVSEDIIVDTHRNPEDLWNPVPVRSRRGGSTMCVSRDDGTGGWRDQQRQRCVRLWGKAPLQELLCG